MRDTRALCGAPSCAPRLDSRRPAPATRPRPTRVLDWRNAVARFEGGLGHESRETLWRIESSNVRFSTPLNGSFPHSETQETRPNSECFFRKTNRYPVTGESGRRLFRQALGRALRRGPVGAHHARTDAVTRREKIISGRARVVRTRNREREESRPSSAVTRVQGSKRCRALKT